MAKTLKDRRDDLMKRQLEKASESPNVKVASAIFERMYRNQTENNTAAHNSAKTLNTEGS